MITRTGYRRGCVLGTLMMFAIISGCEKASEDERPAGGAPATTRPSAAMPTAVELALQPTTRQAVHKLTTAWSGGPARFADEDMTFNIARDYDQRAAVWVQSTSDKPQRLYAEIAGLGDGLLGDFVGAGSAAQPLDLGPGQKQVLSLNLFAQDANRRSYAAHAVLRDGNDHHVIAAAPVTIFVELPKFSVTATAGKEDPGTLARTITVKNAGKGLTDLSAKAGKGLEGKIFFEPAVDHAQLSQDGSLTFKIHPRLSTAFKSAEGEIVLSGAGQETRVPVKFTLPPGTSIFVANSYTTTSAESKGSYCTNNPNTNSKVGGPTPPLWRRLYDKGVNQFSDWWNKPRKIPGLPISTDGRWHYGRNYGPVKVSGSAGAAPGSDPRGPLVDNHVTVSVKVGPFEGSKTLNTTVGISPQVQAPQISSHDNGTINSNEGRQMGQIDDGIDYGGGGQQNRPRGLRVRPAYAAYRSTIEQDNQPESMWAFGRDVVLQAWHTTRWATPEPRAVMFQVWDPEMQPLTKTIIVSDDKTPGQWPAVLALPRQRAIVVWETPSPDGPPSLVYRVSGEGYGTWSPVRPIKGASGTKNAGNYDPIAMMQPDGRVLLIWQQGDGPTGRIMISQVGDDGDFASPHSPQGIPAGASRPVGRIGEDGALHLVFQAPVEGRSAVFYAVSCDNGTTVQSVRQISPKGADAGEADLLVDGQHVYAAFRVGPDWQSRIFWTSSADGGATWATAQPLTPETMYAEYPSLYHHKQGGVGLEYFADDRSNRAGPDGQPRPRTMIKRFDRALREGKWSEPRRLLTGFPTLDAAWLEITFNLISPRSHYKPHEIAVLLNGYEVMHQTNVIPEGTYLLPIDPELLCTDQNGMPANVVGLRTKHMSPGHYQSAADIRLQTRHAFVERLTVASSQQEADQLASAEGEFANHNRADVGLFAPAEPGPLLPARPQRGQPLAVPLRVGNLGEIPAANVRIEVYAEEPAKGAQFKTKPIVPAMELGTLQPMELHAIQVQFPWTGAQRYTIVARTSSADFDPRNNLFSVSFAEPQPPTIQPKHQDPSAQFAVRLDDDPDAPYLWRILQAGTDKEVARVERGTLSSPLPPGRYQLALQRYQYEGQEIRLPQVFEHRSGQKTHLAVRTSVEIQLPTWSGPLYRWEAVKADKPDQIVQWQLGDHPVMILPPGDYQIAIQPTRYTSKRLVWPTTIHLDKDQRIAVKLDSGVAPPPELAAAPSPDQWMLLPENGDEPVQYIQNAWTPLIAPPGRYRWGFQQLRYLSQPVIMPEPIAVKPGEQAVPPPPGTVLVTPAPWTGKPYGGLLVDSKTGNRVQSMAENRFYPMFVPAGEYEFILQPTRYHTKDVPMGKVRVTTGHTERLAIDAGLDVQPLVAAQAPYQLEYLPAGKDTALQTWTDAQWGPQALPPGRYRIALLPTHYTSQRLEWPTGVDVAPGNLTRLVLDSGLRIAGPAGTKPDFQFQILPAGKPNAIQHGEQTWDIQWLPPGAYTVQVRPHSHTPWTTLAENVAVQQGHIADLPMASLPSPRPQAPASGGAGVKR